MISLTKHSLQKLEVIFQEAGYVIRYEKGNFNSGYCIVENRKIIIVNKFYETEARVNTLLELLPTIDVEPALLSEKSAKFYRQALKNEAETVEEQPTPGEM